MTTNKKRGRPPRSRNSEKEEDRLRYQLDLEIARVVFEAVLCGKPYRDGIDDFGALTEGVKKAQTLGIQLSQDGVEALIERIVKDPDTLYNRLPTEVRSSYARLAAGFADNKVVTISSGKRIRNVSLEAYIPDSDEDRPTSIGPRLKMFKKSPGN